MADIDITEIKEINPQKGPKITIIGIGGGGSNMVTDLSTYKPLTLLLARKKPN